MKRPTLMLMTALSARVALVPLALAGGERGEVSMGGQRASLWRPLGD